MWPGRTRTGGRRDGGLLHDFAIGKCLLQFGDARVSDLGPAEIEISQLRQSLEMDQSRVSDVLAIRDADGL